MSLSFRTNGNFIDFVNTDATSLNVETVLMKLHNTSRCIDWSLPEDTTKISFTIDEVKYSNIPISEIDFDGTVMNSQDDFETGITGMFTGLASSGGDSGLLVYTALLTQSGTDAPVATVLGTNTLGFTPTFTREAPGEYTIVKSGGWDSAKTWFVFQPCDAYNDNSCLTIQAEIVNDGPIVNQIYFTTRDVSGNAGDWGAAQGNTKLAIKIEVYP